MKEKEQDKRIFLSHGSGGKLMHDLIRDLFRKKFANKILDQLSDSAFIPEIIPEHNRLCFTTDSYVVNPLFFPGGDIGKLAVCGTINDLCMVGATPLYLSCGFILEEGLELDILEKITDSMAASAKEAHVSIVTGDVKVVEKNKADNVFINTSGIGLRKNSLKLGKEYIEPGDQILINGYIGDHGTAVISARKDFRLETDIQSDCAALTDLTRKILNKGNHIKFMRDPTRGGMATTLNEIAFDTGFGVQIREEDIPVREETRAACEILGLDPLYLANEGKLVIIVGKKEAQGILKLMQSHALGKESRIIGEIVSEPERKVIMKTPMGASRILDMLIGEQMPRIC